MKTKELNAQNLGRGEDWEGNNIAFACPVCGEVCIVSERIHGERKCPSCGRSRGIVTGGRDSGGTASIISDEPLPFVLGKQYSRKEISAILGGSEIEYLPTVNKSVVCGCFTLDCNPQAPDIIIPGTGKVIEREAKVFCEQDYPVPIFLKRRVNEWEYVGDFKAEHFSIAPKDIAAHHNGSITPLNEITRVIF